MSSQKFIPTAHWDAIKPTKKRSFWSDHRGETDIGSMAIGLTVALVIVAYVAPIGIEAVYDINFTGWAFVGEGEDTKATGLMKLLPLFAVLAIVVGVVMIVRDKMR